MNRTDSDLEVIAGRWKVTEIPRAARVDLRAGSMEEQEAGGELIGLVVVLGSQGEVAWEVPPGAPDGVLLFQTSSAHLHKNTLTFVGGEHGCCFTFKVKGEPEAGWMVLESDIDDEGTHISLTLSKEGCSVAVMDNYFSLKKALDECLFSDVMFTCCDGRGVQAHRAVLAAAYPDMQEADWLALFQTQPLHLSQLLLSCIYSDCLPQDLTVIHAKQVVAWLAGHPKLERLSHLMSAFIEGNTLKQKLICLIDELLALLQDAKKTVSIMDMTDSTKVKYTIQHLSKDAALGAAKFVLLCQLYTSNRKEMCKSDRREVLEHLRARVVVFMDLVRELSVEAVQKWEALSQVKQLEVASDLLPDVEQVWDLFLHHATDLRAPLSHTLDRKREVQRGAGISMMLHLISHGSERKRLHKLRKELLDSVEIAQRKREQWQKFSEQEKARQVLNVVGKLVNEIEDLQESMEIRKRQLLLENGLEWRTFHSYVDTACMYMTWGLQKMHSLRDHLKPLLYKVLKFVGRSEVNEAMVYLGLLGRAELEVWLEEGGGDPAADPSSLKLPKSLSRMHPGLEPTRAAESVLAQACVQLASSGHYADMNFVLPSLEGEGSVVIPAHRVIVASRCEWACRALQSGMKEDLEKRIPVPGVDEGVFRLFLQYLYGDPLDTSSMTTESLVDLMEVADRFESHILLSSCESVLVDKIEESSVFPLLAVAERYNARHLRESTMQYILLRPDVIMQEVEGYSSLSESLQQELRDLLSGTQDPMLALRHSQPASVCATTSPSLEQGYPQSSESGASSEDEEELQLESDAAVWEAALEDLRAIVGAEVSNDVLRDLLLAADMDVNRAVNFFFNSQ